MRIADRELKVTLLMAAADRVAAALKAARSEATVAIRRDDASLLAALIRSKLDEPPFSHLHKIRAEILRMTDRITDTLEQQGQAAGMRKKAQLVMLPHDEVSVIWSLFVTGMGTQRIGAQPPTNKRR